MANPDREASIGVNPETPQQFKGVLHLYSETGTEGGFWALQDERFITRGKGVPFGEQWSYEGLHILKDGDSLTIYSKENAEETVWDGEISLKRHPLFTEHVGGLWIHADQNGIDRETWAGYFSNGHQAKLIPNRQHQDLK